MYHDLPSYLFIYVYIYIYTSIYLYVFLSLYLFVYLCIYWDCARTGKNGNKSMPLGYLMPGTTNILAVIVMHEKHQQQKELLPHAQAQIRSLDDRGFNMFQQVATMVTVFQVTKIQQTLVYRANSRSTEWHHLPPIPHPPPLLDEDRHGC